LGFVNVFLSGFFRVSSFVQVHFRFFSGFKFFWLFLGFRFFQFFGAPAGENETHT
jgi:hypothetical protein